MVGFKCYFLLKIGNDTNRTKSKNLPGTNGKVLVVWAGIEPATQGFSVLCSTN
jgi:hypothetical protein